MFLRRRVSCRSCGGHNNKAFDYTREIYFETRLGVQVLQTRQGAIAHLDGAFAFFLLLTYSAQLANFPFLECQLLLTEASKTRRRKWAIIINGQVTAITGAVLLNFNIDGTSFQQY